jgi:hypothetical protein
VCGVWYLLPQPHQIYIAGNDLAILDRNPLLGVLFEQRFEVLIDPYMILCKGEEFFTELITHQ